MRSVAGPARKKYRKHGMWDNVILPAAAEIVASYETRVTLRQLFYRLVVEEVLLNTQNEYNQLSSRSAKARRQGSFPSLMDAGRAIVQPNSWTNPEKAREDLRRLYRRDRTEGQKQQLYLGVEKAGLVQQLRVWFGQPFGIPILPTGGYSSESFEAEILTHSHTDGRPTVLLYGGDLDPSGEDIERNLLRWTDFDIAKRIAVTPEQIVEFALPTLPGKASDSRAATFESKHGRLFQVEVDALAPDVLRGLFADAIAEFWDDDAYNVVLSQEQAERETL
jgi:hypothetical protein